jgi:hypothetical protein
MSKLVDTSIIDASSIWDQRQNVNHICTCSGNSNLGHDSEIQEISLALCRMILPIVPQSVKDNFRFMNHAEFGVC